MPRLSGTYEQTTTSGESVAAFVPYPLPARDPPLTFTSGLHQLILHAERSLQMLDLAGDMVPSKNWFVYAFARKEAVISSQIEGTQATLIDLLEFEATGKPHTYIQDDIEEISNYVAALKYARAQLRRNDGLPISLRLLNETHKRLMAGVRGANKLPGEIRRSQNWLGGNRPSNAVFVPPPPHVLGKLLSALEQYIHTDDTLPPVVRIGLLHVQFETIHPYLDGNGRIGRLLITLLLEHWGLLHTPLLYLSTYFKQTRHEYYQRLSAVRTTGDWEGWLEYFLRGVSETAEQSIATARVLFALCNNDRQRILKQPGSSLAAARLFEELPTHPILTIAKVVTLLETTKPTAAKAVDALVQAGVLKEISHQPRDRVFVYSRYLKCLKSGTDLGENL